MDGTLVHMAYLGPTSTDQRFLSINKGGNNQFMNGVRYVIVNFMEKLFSDGFSGVKNFIVRVLDSKSEFRMYFFNINRLKIY